MKSNFLPFEEAREFVRSLNLKNHTEWREWFKIGMRPSNIPTNPNKIYKNKGWLGWGDFLGTGNVAPKNRTYLTFEEARQFTHSLNLKDYNEWNKWSKSGARPLNIPCNPHRLYKSNGWKGYEDFLGTKRNEYISFEESRQYARSLKLKSQAEWIKWTKSGIKPSNIPLLASRMDQMD